MRRELHQSREIANRKRTEPYCVIPFLLPPSKNPCPARAQKASQAGRRRFDPGRPLSLRAVTRQGFFSWPSDRPGSRSDFSIAEAPTGRGLIISLEKYEICELAR